MRKKKPSSQKGLSGRLSASFADQIRQVASHRYGSDKSISIDTFASWQEGASGLTSVSDQQIPTSTWRLGVLALGLFLLGLIIFGRLFMLQVVKGEEYYVRSERNRMYVHNVTAQRGVLYDRNGEVLARNAPAFSVGFVYSEIPAAARDEVKAALKRNLSLSVEEVDEIFTFAESQPNTQTILKKFISYDEQLSIKVISDDLPGVFIVEDMIREYPKGEYFSAILGYTGEISQEELTEKDPQKYTLKSSTGKAGLEYYYEDELTGMLGRKLVEVEATGKVTNESLQIEAVAGTDLVLTIDSVVQNKLGELLTNALTDFDATGGSIVVMNPRNGEILGMVSLPTYDNNIFNGSYEGVSEVLTDPRGLLLNRAINGVYAPGSTVKMAIGAEALQEGVITPTTKISGEPQVIRVGGFEFPDWTYSWGRGPHGLMDLPGAISVSSDIFFYKVGGGYPPNCGSGGEQCIVYGLGVNGLVRGLEGFGFGQRTGIDLPNENPGLVPDPAWKQEVRGEDWYLGNTYHLSIGQGDLLATPIQILNLTNTVATDSQTPIPHLLRTPELVTEHGLDSKREKPVYVENIRVVREGMVEAVSEGIVYSLRGAVVPVAAKTGTAEFGTLDAKGEYDTHAWVTGFAPVENPGISFVVMLESGGKSSNAADVARLLVDWYYGEYQPSAQR